MKLLKFPAFIFFIVFAFSCTEGELPEVHADVTGQWRLTELDYSGVTVVDWLGERLESNFEGKGQDLDCTLTIQESPNTFTAEGDYVVMLRYDLYGQQAELPVSMEGFMSNGMWNRSGDQLSVQSEGEPASSCTILELTHEKMVLSYEGVISQSMDGVTNTSTLLGAYTFVRE